MSTPIIPSYEPYRCSYTYQLLEDGWYHSIPFQSLSYRLPARLQMETARRSDYQSKGADTIIHGTMENGRWSFFTGLIPTCETGFTRGDHFHYSNGNRSKSLVIVYQQDTEWLTLVYYPNFWIADETELVEFVCNEVDQIRVTLVR
jgi:hypothetical protein